MIREEADPEASRQRSVRQHRRPAQDPLETLAVRVASKLEEGILRGQSLLLAWKTLSLNSVTEPFRPSRKNTLHPIPILVPPAPTGGQAVQVSPEEVARAIRSFPCGSVGGPDGLCPQHLKDTIDTDGEG